ncbi:hypothetical protein JOE68_005261 [Saccharothrix algeriensis]|uniref:Transposase n=1 Tax=Saccharothrix algeriensis TaxID=173560 RepID=A0ABS2SDQ9_9PSEU|nr:hypothetical protein [Saccharothrix algeriensis]
MQYPVSPIGYLTFRRFRDRRGKKKHICAVECGRSLLLLWRSVMAEWLRVGRVRVI